MSTGRNPVHEPNLSAELSVLTLTTRERRVIRRALTMSAAMMDALGDYSCAASMVEIADRVHPGDLDDE